MQLCYELFFDLNNFSFFILSQKHRYLQVMNDFENAQYFHRKQWLKNV